MKKATFFIDDVLWVFRDLTREKPASLFDNEYMAMLKKAHDEYGVKTQLNAFYKTSFWYGDDEFSLSDMTDVYKKEWEEASDWLRIGFHSKEEWPDYPYINADYSLVNNNFNLIRNEVIRFAGEKSFAMCALPHWAPMSREGIKALYDNGVRVSYATYGKRVDFEESEASLPYGHSFRLLHNRKKESGIYRKVTRDTAIANALCSYNHIPEEAYKSCLGKYKTYKDQETGMNYMSAAQVVLNLTPIEILEEEISKFAKQEFLALATHEQYFYSDYYAYQPYYAEEIYAMGKIMKENGFEFIFAEDLPH
ncbi:MAG: hypothetical protein IJD91_06385 [Clostridia bacterium]|nr:hypothetical protein [Clostridia bacterium]